MAEFVSLPSLVGMLGDLHEGTVDHDDVVAEIRHRLSGLQCGILNRLISEGPLPLSERRFQTSAAFLVECGLAVKVVVGGNPNYFAARPIAIKVMK